jgi:hypothetical protein
MLDNQVLYFNYSLIQFLYGKTIITKHERQRAP